MSFIPGNTGVASSFPDGFLVADGLVTAPTFRFQDSQTGFYRPGLNQFALSSNGVQSWLVSAAGAFTIGPAAANVTHRIYGKASTTDTGSDRVGNPMLYLLSNSTQSGSLAIGYSENTNKTYFAAFGNGAPISDGFEFWTENAVGIQRTALSTGAGAWTFGSTTQTTGHILQGFAGGGYSALTLSNVSTGEVNLDFNRGGANRWQISVATNNGMGFYDFSIASSVAIAAPGAGSWNLGTGGNTSRINAQQLLITRAANINTVTSSLSGSVPIGYSGSGYSATGYNFQHTGTTNTHYREGSDTVSVLTYGAAAGALGTAVFCFHGLASGGSAGNFSVASGNMIGYAVPGGQWYKPGGGSWADSSDARLKTDIVDITGSLEKLMLLTPSSFFRLDRQRSESGFVAQNFQTAFPEFVTEDDVPEHLAEYFDEPGAKVKGLDLNMGFTAHLVKAIQELKAELDAAKARISTLEGV